MFVVGLFFKLIKIWFILALAILLFVLLIFVPEMPIAIPCAVLILWFALAIIQQCKDVRTLLHMNGNDSTNDLLDEMLKDNNKGYRNVVDAVNEIIERNDLDS